MVGNVAKTLREKPLDPLCIKAWRVLEGDWDFKNEHWDNGKIRSRSPCWVTTDAMGICIICIIMQNLLCHTLAEKFPAAGHSALPFGHKKRGTEGVVSSPGCASRTVWSAG